MLANEHVGMNAQRRTGRVDNQSGGGLMKGKPTWKPAGLSAKRWREAGQTAGPANLLPPPKPFRKEARRKKVGKQWPFEQEGP
jgi:hypothetical protein